MKIVIVYYTFTGNNEILANELQARLGCDSYKITELKKRGMFTILLDMIFRRNPAIENPDRLFNQYDHVILSAPVWGGRIANPLKSFIKRERANIKAYSFITACGKAGNEKLVSELTKLTQKKPTAFAELAIDHILPPGKKKTTKQVSAYRLQKHDLAGFEKELNIFQKKIYGDPSVKFVITPTDLN